MPSLRRTAGHLIGLAIAVLYTMAGQAHFTDKYTPNLAAQIEEMTPRSHQAFHFLNLEYAQLKQLFGAFDLLAAALLFTGSTRRAGLKMAVVGFAGGLYGQWYTGGEMGQVGAMFGMAVLGAMLL